MQNNNISINNNIHEVSDISLNCSFDSTQIFQELCHSVLFGDSSAQHHEPYTTSDHLIPVIDLVPKRNDKRRIFKSDFDETTNELKESIDKMAELLMRETKFDGFKDYVHEGIGDESSSTMHLETTVASFVARSANQIEQLRATIYIPPPSNEGEVGSPVVFYKSRYNASVANHRSGVVACLLILLRENVAGVLTHLQRRRRELEKKKKSLKPVRKFFDEDFETKSISSESASRKGLDKDQLDPLTKEAPRYPSSINNSGSNQKVFDVKTKQSRSSDVIFHSAMAGDGEMDYNEIAGDNSYHQQQTMHLEVKEPESEVMDVKAIEQQIMNITTLLSQFSALVSEQQEDVIVVHSNTTITKENVTKGQEQLIDAKDRLSKSRHRMAKFIFVMGIATLFLNWIIV